MSLKLQLFVLCALCMLAVVLCKDEMVDVPKNTADLKPDDAFYLRSVYNPYISSWGLYMGAYRGLYGYGSYII